MTPAEKFIEGIDRLKLKIRAFLLQIVDRKAGKEVALETSKINCPVSREVLRGIDRLSLELPQRRPRNTNR